MEGEKGRGREGQRKEGKKKEKGREEKMKKKGMENAFDILRTSKAHELALSWHAMLGMGLTLRVL